jgi:hypothetical protein
MAVFLPIVTDFKSDGIDKAVKEFRNLESASDKAQFAIKKAALPAAAALAGLGYAGFQAAQAAMEDAAAAEQLATQLKNTTGATDSQIKSVEDWISKTSVAAAVADDELRPALAALVRGTGDVGQAQELMGLALDISAGTGKDLASVSDALSKAYNGNFKSLKALDPALTELIGSGADADLVFGRLSSTFGGQASAAANTAQGKMKSFSIQMGEAKEAIGAAILPLAEKLLPALKSLAEYVQRNSDVIVPLALVLGGFALAIVAVNAAMTAWAAIGTATTAINGLLSTSFTTLQVATGAAVILALIAAIVVLQAKFDILGKAVDGITWVFDKLWGGIKAGFNWVKDNWPLLLGIITGPFGWAVLAVTTFKDEILNVFDKIKSVAGTVFDGLSGAFKAAINGVLAGIEGGLNFAIKGLNVALDGIDKAAGPWVNFGEIPNVKIPRLAEGGITTGPTLAMIGEAGQEAVIPLDKLKGLGSGAGVTINVNGALDPVSTARQIRQILQQDASRLGLASVV